MTHSSIARRVEKTRLKNCFQRRRFSSREQVGTRRTLKPRSQMVTGEVQVRRVAQARVPLRQAQIHRAPAHPAPIRPLAVRVRRHRRIRAQRQPRQATSLSLSRHLRLVARPRHSVN